MKRRVIAYIDGFNLYRAMRDERLRKLLWLDLHALAKHLCPKDGEIVAVKYVTARKLNLQQPGSPHYAEEENSRRRQSTYIDALKVRGVSVFEGRFKRRHITCRNCRSTWCKPEEKASDVHLATQLLCDAFRSKFDTALIMSGDADMSPAIRVVTEELGLAVVIAFPPRRVLEELKQIATSVLHINRQVLAKSQLPPIVMDGTRKLMRPQAWS